MFDFVGELIDPHFFGDWCHLREDNPGYEELAYYDGPITFSFVKPHVVSPKITELPRYLAHALDMGADKMRYLVSPIGQWAYFQLKENRLPILDALAAPVSYVVDEGLHVEIWKTTINEMPPDHLPQAGVYLYAR
jgi:hypothetical protein